MAEWQHAMSSHEFTEWIAFSRLQPFGERRADMRMAMMMAQMANIFRDPKSSKEFTAEDFMPDFEKALDEMNEREEIPEKERVWQKVKSVFGSLVERSKKIMPSRNSSRR